MDVRMAVKTAIGMADETAFETRHAGRLERLELPEELRQVDDDTVAHNVHRARVEHAAREKVERVLVALLIHNRVSGIRAALAPWSPASVTGLAREQADPPTTHHPASARTDRGVAP